MPILLVEQNAVAALDLTAHGYVMESERVLLDEPAAQFKANEDAKEFYLRDVKHDKRRKRWLG